MTYHLSRDFCWEVTIIILKKLGRRYRLGKLPSGKLLFIDLKTKEIVEIPKSNSHARH